MPVETINIIDAQKRLEEIGKQIKELKNKRSEIKREYVPCVKNPLMGYVALFGEESLRTLGKPKNEWDKNLDGGREYFRELYFKDIRYRSKLRKINGEISNLENEYHITLLVIRSSIARGYKATSSLM